MHPIRPLRAAPLLLKFQFLPAQHQSGARLVVELGGDIKTLGLSQLIARDFLRSTVRQLVGSGQERKFAPLQIIHIKANFIHYLVKETKHPEGQFGAVGHIPVVGKIIKVLRTTNTF